MSIADQYAEIAAALTTVTGVTGYAFMPAAPKVGDGWPLLARGDRGPGTAFVHTWRVRVAVPGSDSAAAVDFWDEHWEPLFVALQGIGEVDAFQPVEIATNNGPVWAYEMIMRTGE